jgi:two-component system OmpR family response regulator
MEPVRILFVDDEPGTRLTLPEALRQHGFSVTAVGTVNEALAEITSAQFDVLISDLNLRMALTTIKPSAGWSKGCSRNV